MTDSMAMAHLSGPLLDDKAHPPSAIHYRLSLPEARASIMLPLGDDAGPRTGEPHGPTVAGGHSRVCTSLPPSNPSPHLPGAWPPPSLRGWEPPLPGMDPNLPPQMVNVMLPEPCQRGTRARVLKMIVEFCFALIKRETEHPHSGWLLRET